ncbi:MAG TPA: RDD family protein [Pirellulaceae bacterium]|nr:RDD family protein [Pirellulaceae bacterium]
MAQRAEQLDSIIRVITPENIAFEYRVAGPFRRLPAYLIDLVVIFVLCFAISIFLIPLLFVSPGTAMFIQLVSWFAIGWFYCGVLEAIFNGQTLGKWLLGLRTVNYDGLPINALQAIVRNLLRYADTFLVMAGLLVMAMNSRFQRLGDLVAGTIVIVEERHWLTGIAKLDDPRAIQLAAHLPPNFVISRSLAKALATYVERRRFFHPVRRREVAKHLAEPLLARFGLPLDTSYDLLLCSLYYRKFIADRGADERQFAAATQAVGPPPGYGQPPYGQQPVYGPGPGGYQPR